MKKRIRFIIIHTLTLTCFGGAFVYLFQPELTLAKNLNYINATIYLITSIMLLFSIIAFSIAITICVADGATKDNLKELKRIVDRKQYINSKLSFIYYIIAIVYVITCVLFSSIIGISPILVLLHTIFTTILRFKIIPWAESEMNKMQSELDKHNEALKQNPWFQELKKITGED